MPFEWTRSAMIAGSNMLGLTAYTAVPRPGGYEFSWEESALRITGVKASELSRESALRTLFGEAYPDWLYHIKKLARACPLSGNTTSIPRKEGLASAIASVEATRV